MIKENKLIQQLTEHSAYALDEFDKIKIEFMEENEIPNRIIIEEIPDEKAIVFDYHQRNKKEIIEFINNSDDFESIDEYLYKLKERFTQKASEYLKNKNIQLNLVTDYLINNAQASYIQSFLSTEDDENMAIILDYTIQDIRMRKQNNEELQIIKNWQVEIGFADPDITAIKNMKKKLVSKVCKTKLQKANIE